MWDFWSTYPDARVHTLVQVLCGHTDLLCSHTDLLCSYTDLLCSYTDLLCSLSAPSVVAIYFCQPLTGKKIRMSGVGSVNVYLVIRRVVYIHNNFLLCPLKVINVGWILWSVWQSERRNISIFVVHIFNTYLMVNTLNIMCCQQLIPSNP